MTVKKSSRKVTAAVAAFVSAGLILSACGNDGNGGGGNGNGAGTENAGEGVIGDDTPLKVMIPLLESQAPDPEGEMQTAIEELIGRDLDITWVPNSNYGDRTNVTLASDDIPHVMVVQGKIPAFVQAAEAGAFWDLTDYLSQYPNLTPETEEVRLNASINGRSYGIYRMRDAMRVAVIIRKDWLENLGLEAPENVNDLRAIAEAFTFDDPDGNGQDDTYGLIIPQWPGGYGTSSPYDVIETWFGAPNMWGVNDDGTYYPGFDTDEFIEGATFVREMIADGLVNQDFATMDSATWNEPFFNGKGGIIIDVSSRFGALNNLFKQDDESTFHEKVLMVGNLEGPDGELHAYPTLGYNGFLAISKQSVPTEADLHKVLEVLDKLSSEEGQNLLNNGIEGVTYTVEDGYAIGNPDPAVEVIANDKTAFAQLGTQSNGYLAYRSRPATEYEIEMDQRRWDIHEHDLKFAVHNPAQPYISPTYNTQGAPLDILIADARLKYVAGMIDEAGLKAEIQRWYSEGGQKIVDELSELAAAAK